MKRVRKTERFVQIFLVIAIASAMVLPSILVNAVQFDWTSTFNGTAALTDYTLYKPSGDYTTKTSLRFNVTPKFADSSGAIGYTDTSIAVTGETDLAMLVILTTDGKFAVRDGSSDVVSSFSYTASSSYNIEVQADLASKTYSVWVQNGTAYNSARTQIGTNCAFNTKDSSTAGANTDDVGKIAMIQSNHSGSNVFTVAAHNIFRMIDSSTTYTSGYTGTYSGVAPNTTGDYMRPLAYSLGNSNTGIVYTQFDGTPSALAMDQHAINYADGDQMNPTYAQANCYITYAATNNYIQARNGTTTTAVNNMTYSAGTTYHFETIINLNTNKYSVWATAPSGVRTQIASDYSFRTTGLSINDVGKAVIWVDNASKTHTVANHKVFTMNSTSTVNPTIGTVTVGEADVTPTDFTAPGAGEAIVWESYNTARATVNSSTGAVHGVAGGAVTIAYKVYNTTTNEITTVGTADITVQAAFLEQDAPTGLSGVSATTVDNNDAKITGTTTAMEYRANGVESYTACTDTETTGLSAGTYYVRYAAKTGYHASPDTEVVIANQTQSAPSVSAVIATTGSNNDAKISGTTTAMEYKHGNASTYTACSDTDTAVAPGYYNVRYAAKTGFDASSDTNVRVGFYDTTPGTAIDTAYSIKYSNGSFTNVCNLGTSNTGNVKITCDVTPIGTLTEGIMAWGDSSKTTTFTNSAVFVVFAGGYFKVRNGTGWVTTTTTYSADTKYYIELEINTTAKTHNIYVTPEGGARVQIATNYGFRDTTTDDIGKLVLDTEDVATDLYKVENHVVYANQDAPTGLAGVAPTTASNNNGKITGTTTQMEYKLSSDESYTACSDGETTGLATGDYDVRYAERFGYNVSSATSVRVATGLASTTVTLTVGGTDNTVNIAGWEDDYQYQIWSYQKITSDTLLDSSSNVQNNQWILSKGYTLGSAYDVFEVDGSISFTIDSFTSPFSSYVISVKIKDASGNYVGEIKNSFTPAEVGEVVISKVLVDNKFSTGKETKEIAVDANVDIEVVGNGIEGTEYTATLREGAISIPASGAANTFPWDISGFEPGKYSVILNATNGVTSDTRIIEFQLYSASATTYSVISNMTASNSQIVPTFADGNFYFTYGEQGRTPIYTSGLITHDQFVALGNKIDNSISDYGVYIVVGLTKRAGSDSVDDMIFKRVNVLRQEITPNSATLNANVNIDNPVLKGTAIEFTASATIPDIGANPVEYSFWRHDATGMVLVKDYSADNTLDWTPARIGKYKITVRAKGTDAASYEVEKTVDVNVTDAVDEIAAGVSIDINETELEANAIPRVPINIEATATSSNSADLLYKFFVSDGFAGTVMLQGYSSDETCSWIPRKSGTYTITVAVKNSASFGMYDGVESFNITVA